eukprot:3309440-Amphidinium_carterae.2
MNRGGMIVTVFCFLGLQPDAVSACIVAMGFCVVCVLKVAFPSFNLQSDWTAASREVVSEPNEGTQGIVHKGICPK